MGRNNIKTDHERDIRMATSSPGSGQCPVAGFGNMTIRIRSSIKVGGISWPSWSSRKTLLHGVRVIKKSVIRLCT
jgi:hypothetical protein